MKYQNAKDVLPKELLREVKKYAAGSLLYIPLDDAGCPETQPKKPLSEFRKNLIIRNQRILNKYLSGKSISDLADKYFLSLDTIKKMIYGKKKSGIPFDFDLATAAKYSSNGLAQEWVRTYLLRKTGEETAYHDQWKVDGLLRFPLRLIDTTTIPPYEIRNGEPLIVIYAHHQFTLWAHEATLINLTHQKQFSAPAFIILEDENDYPYYYENYGKPFSNGRMYEE